MNCPIWITKEVAREDQRKAETRKTLREACGNPAREYLVRGDSYSVTQVMCEMHKRMAEAEGFRIVELSRLEALVNG